MAVGTTTRRLAMAVQCGTASPSLAVPRPGFRCANGPTRKAPACALVPSCSTRRSLSPLHSFPVNRLAACVFHAREKKKPAAGFALSVYFVLRRYTKYTCVLPLLGIVVRKAGFRITRDRWLLGPAKSTRNGTQHVMASAFGLPRTASSIHPSAEPSVSMLDSKKSGFLRTCRA